MMDAVSKEKHPMPLLFSLLLHIIVIMALIVSFEFSARTPVLENADKNKEIINARVITSMPAQKPTKMVPQPEKIIPKPVVLPQPPQPKQSPLSEPKPALLKTQTKPLPVLPKKPAIAILDKKEKKLEEDRIAQQLLADIKKQQTHRQKKIKQKAVTADFAKDVKQLAASEFAKDLKQLAAKSLQQDMLQEQKRMAGARNQQIQGEVNKYMALIQQAISQHWRLPPSVNKKLYAELMIRVAPGGMVMDVQVVKTSGDNELDNSARTAVLKASPLPVPHDMDAFETFRQFILKVRPKDILNADSWES